MSEYDNNIIYTCWKDEPYLNILLHQHEPTRPIVERLESLNKQGKCITQTDVIGLLKHLNNALLDKYTIQEYLEGIDVLCEYYPHYKKSDKAEIRIKKGWMSECHRAKLFSYTQV